jgi:hypothetical protein
MFGVGVGVRVGGFTASSGGGFDPDAQAFFDRVSTAGGTLSETEKNATNQLVLDMKSAGIWSSMQAIYPMVGASAAACAQNLVSSSFTGSFNGSVTFASTGVTGNGVNGYMTTGYVTNTNGLLNSAHLSFYSRTNIVASQVEMGVTGGGGSNYLLFNFGGTVYCAINSLENTGPTVPPTTLGFKIGSRTNSSAEDYNVNNTVQTISRTSGNLATIPMYLLCYNNGNAALFSTKECAFASIGRGLSLAQMTSFQTLMTTFQTSLSRNV